MFGRDTFRRLELELAQVDYRLGKLRCEISGHRTALRGADGATEDIDQAVVDSGHHLRGMYRNGLARENGTSAGGEAIDFEKVGRRWGSEALASGEGSDQWSNQRTSTRRSNGSSGSKLMELKEIIIAAISAVASGATAWITAIRKYRADALRSQLEERKLYVDSLKELVTTMNQEIAEYKAEIVQLRQELEQARARIFELEEEVQRLKQQLRMHGG